MNAEAGINEEINVLCDVSDMMQLEATLQCSYKGGVITGGVALVCGLLLGPIGFPIGGVIGGLAATAVTWKKFVPASVAIKKLSKANKLKLVAHVKKCLSGTGAANAASLLQSVLTGDKNMHRRIAMFITEFFYDVMNTKIVSKPNPKEHGPQQKQRKKGGESKIN